MGGGHATEQIVKSAFVLTIITLLFIKQIPKVSIQINLKNTKKQGKAETWLKFPPPLPPIQLRNIYIFMVIIIAIFLIALLFCDLATARQTNTKLLLRRKIYINNPCDKKVAMETSKIFNIIMFYIARNIIVLENKLKAMITSISGKATQLCI